MSTPEEATTAVVQEVTQPKTAADVADKALDIASENMDALGAGIKALAQKAMESGGDLMTVLQTEIPDVLEQLIKWKMAEAGFAILYSVAIIWMLIYVGKRWFAIVNGWKDAYDKDHSGDSFWNYADSAIPAIGGTFIFLVVASMWGGIRFAALYSNAVDFLQLFFAPKVYILQYISQYF